MFSFLYGVIAGVCVSQIFNLKQLACDVYTTMYHTSSLQKISSSLYSLSYEHRGKQYRVLMPVQKGPKRIVRITDDQERDVTEEVRVFLGPNEDFHQYPTTPRALGYKELVFQERSGMVYIFTEDDAIHF